MFRYFFLIVTPLLLTSCMLDFQLLSTLDEPSVVLPEDAISAGFVNQSLPTSLNKTAAHFGTIDPAKYYFIQPGDSSKVVRKFVKISGGVKTELALPDDVISHRYAFSTTSKVYYFENVRLTPTTSGRFLKSLDKASFALVDWQCNGFDVDLDVDDFEVFREGAEGFYFRLTSANPAISASNGRIFYSDGATCVDTGIIAKKLWSASGKLYAVDQGSSLRQVIAGVPQAVLIDGATNPVMSGMVVYNGDLYYRVQTAAGPTYQIQRMETSAANATTNMGFDTANWVGLDAETVTYDNITFVWCRTGKCIGTGTAYYVTMTSIGAPITLYSGANFGPARILPFPATINIAMGVSGREVFRRIDGSTLASRINTGLDSEYLGTAATEKVPENFPQQVTIGNFHLSEFFDTTTGQSSVRAVNITANTVAEAFPALRNTHSLRVRDGELFFLGHNDEKVQLYRGDGTPGGTAAVAEITSDDYRLTDDFTTSTRLVRRTFDISKEGADIYVFTASQESVYLAEYSAGNMKYVKIPAASYSLYYSRILKVENGTIYFATPAHYHMGADTVGTSQPLHHTPGVQIVSYNGAAFSYWLKTNYALPAYTSYSFPITGESWLAIGTNRILSILVSSRKAAGFYLRHTFSLTSSTQTDTTNESTPHSRASANGDRVIYNIADSATQDGIYLERSGVQLKLTTTAEEARMFRWNGTTVYFLALDTVDGLEYIWQLDTTQTTPAPAKISAAVTVGTAKDEAYSKRIFTVGTDIYMLFPVATSISTSISTTAFSLWKLTAGMVAIDSANEVEEVLTVSDGFYYIGKLTSGPDSGKRCIFKNTSEGVGQTTCDKYMASLKPSALGVSVAMDGKHFQLKKDLTLTEIAPLFGGTASATDFELTLDSLSSSDTFNDAAALCRFTSAGGKVQNLGLDSAGSTWSAITKNTDGTSSSETAFTGSEINVDLTAGVVMQTTERVNYSSFRVGYTPNPNSLLFATRDSALGERFRIFGTAAPLNANIP